MKRFSLDAEQTDAILELKLYRLARLEILVIQQELDREAQARPPDFDAAEGRRRPLEAGARGARGDPEQVRQPEDRSAPLAHRGSRRSRILRRLLHRRGRQRRDRVARWVGEAAEGSEGPVDDAPARRRRGAGGRCRQHQGDDGVLQQLRRGLHQPHRRRAGVDRLRRSGAEAVQAEGRREDRRRVQPRSARREEDRGEEGRRRAAGARARGHQRWLRDALLAAGRSSKPARDPAAAMRAPRTAPKWSASASPPARKP